MTLIIISAIFIGCGNSTTLYKNESKKQSAVQTENENSNDEKFTFPAEYNIEADNVTNTSEFNPITNYYLKEIKNDYLQINYTEKGQADVEYFEFLGDTQINYAFNKNGTINKIDITCFSSIAENNELKFDTLSVNYRKSGDNYIGEATGTAKVNLSEEGKMAYDNQELILNIEFTVTYNSNGQVIKKEIKTTNINDPNDAGSNKTLYSTYDYDYYGNNVREHHELYSLITKLLEEVTIKYNSKREITYEYSSLGKSDAKKYYDYDNTSGGISRSYDIIDGKIHNECYYTWAKRSK